jgi:hypothetical protein
MSSNVKAKSNGNRQPENIKLKVKVKVKVKDENATSKRLGTTWSSKSALSEKIIIEIQVLSPRHARRPCRRRKKEACTKEYTSSRQLDALLPMRWDHFTCSRRPASQG